MNLEEILRKMDAVAIIIALILVSWFCMWYTDTEISKLRDSMSIVNQKGVK